MPRHEEVPRLPSEQESIERAMKHLSSSPYGQMVLLLDYKGYFQALQVEVLPPCDR